MNRLQRVTCILCCGLLLAGQGGEGDLDSAFSRDTLLIAASEHACHVFEVYLALTPAQHSRGLMWVRYLPPFTGMLFIYPQQRTLSMWMKNTYIPLDILFIRADGSIANVATDTVPLTLDSVTAIEPLNYALELNAGVTERLHIDSGSTVIFSDAQRAPDRR